ncbi:MAG: GHKL domain-containing protein [Peptostreptococcaceae bacterium]|nr:GHKL domain-containing protein [Peptostreptococcaceae bacterium]
MFDKLKLKLIAINMAMLITVFIAIFGSIFLITSNNISREIDENLYALIYGSKRPIPHTVNIVVEIGSNGRIKAQFRSFEANITNDNLQEVVSNILKSNKLSGKVKIADSNYSYLIGNGIFGTKIAFIETSQYDTVLFQLVKSLVGIGLVSLIGLLFISIYLTNKSIIPIKEAFEKQKQFIADASHELKTPLAIIKTNTSLVLSHPEDTINNQSKWINYINSQADRMSELISEMLSLAKMDDAENKLTLVPINMSKIVESMILMFDAVIYENNINLETNISKDLHINGDKESLKKLFSIIMDNAIKYTDKNGSITVSLFSDKNKVKMIIRNTGEGIAPEDLERVFERFYRVDKSRDRETGGYGLGLSIASSIVKEHKGKIYARSKVGSFTSFIVEIPQQTVIKD